MCHYEIYVQEHNQTRAVIYAIYFSLPIAIKSAIELSSFYLLTYVMDNQTGEIYYRSDK